MAATRVQTKTGKSSGYATTCALTWDGNTTSGSTIIVAVCYNNDYAGNVSTIVDSQSNTYTKINDGAVADVNGELWYAYNITGGTTPTITITMTDGFDVCAIAREYSGLLTTDPLDVSSEGTTSNTTSHTSATTASTNQANELVVAMLAGSYNSTYTLGSGYSNLANINANDLYGSIAIEDKDVTSTGTQSATITTGTAINGYFAVSTFKEATGGGASLNQEGFAFGDDNGSESAHTLGTQDTDLSAELGTKTLRAIVDATGDPGATAFKLKYQKNGSGGYIDVPVGAGGVTQPVIEVGDCTESGNNTASGSWAVSYPNASTGDLLIFNISWDDSTTTTDVTAPSGPNGETLNVIQGPTADSGTAVRGKAWYTKATGSWTASTLTFTPSANEQWTAVVIRVPAGEFDATTPIGASDSEATNSTSTPTTCSFSAGASDGGGTLVSVFCTDVDDCDGTMSGWTNLTSTDRGATAMDVSVRNAAVTNSETITGTTGYTLPLARAQVAIDYIVRGASYVNEVYVSTSSNVASGGEATTARLTAPSGKSGNFTTGRRWDDENGSDSIDIAEDYYTELEWVLTTQSPATTSDYFDFRVYAGDAALDTYTVTPRWTIAANTSPTVALDSPSDTATVGSTPDLAFTGTDAESDDVRYNVQVMKAITLNTSSYGRSTGTDTLTYSHTVSTGDNRILVVTVSTKSSTIETNTSVTYGGSAMDLAIRQIGNGATNMVVEIWTKVAATEGTANVVVTATGTCEEIQSNAVTAYNADQSNWDVDSSRTDVNATSISSTITLTNKYSLIIEVMGTNSGSTLTATTGQSVMHNFQAVGYGNSVHSYEYVTASGDETNTYTLGTSTLAELAQIGLTPAVYLDKVSGTDSGFSGSPDNSDPFTSAQQVIYTVQSSLSSGTYYWRARGIDPSGTNSYGAWSTARSFDVVADTGNADFFAFFRP